MWYNILFILLFYLLVFMFTPSKKKPKMTYNRHPVRIKPYTGKDGRILVKIYTPYPRTLSVFLTSFDAKLFPTHHRIEVFYLNEDGVPFQVFMKDLISAVKQHSTNITID